MVCESLSSEMKSTASLFCVIVSVQVSDTWMIFSAWLSPPCFVTLYSPNITVPPSLLASSEDSQMSRNNRQLSSHSIKVFKVLLFGNLKSAPQQGLARIFYSLFETNRDKSYFWHNVCYNGFDKPVLAFSRSVLLFHKWSS